MREVRIAVSGKSGCGNTTVSRRLAGRLDVQLVNYTFRTMAEEEGISFEELCRLAEKDDSWDRRLDQRQVELARQGSCVLGSRLAVWVLPEADLSVYLSASPEVRAARIREREGGDLRDVMETTAHRDHRDRERYLRLYAIDVDDHGFVDLEVDTETMAPDEIVEHIVRALQQRSSP